MFVKHNVNSSVYIIIKQFFKKIKCEVRCDINLKLASSISYATATRGIYWV